MKLRVTCVLGFLSLALALVPQMVAQTTAETTSALSRLVRFSGRVKDLDGNFPTGVVGITFALYSEQTGGAALWLETQNVTTDSKGHYMALLGSTNLDGLPTELFTSEQARWIGVQISGQAEQPRVLLVSEPYALKAGDAKTIGGLPPSAFVLNPRASGGDRTNSGAASSPLSAPVPPPASSEVTTKGGTMNAIPLFTTATNIQNSIVTQTGNTSVNVAGPLSLGANALTAGNVNASGNVTAGGVTGILNAAACGTTPAPTWCTGTDIGGWINAAYTYCANNCIVEIPPGNYPYKTTINMTTEGDSLVGAGSYATILSYGGSGDGILWQMANWNPGIKKAGALRGLSVIGTSSAVNCIHSGSLQGSTWDDVTVSGCTGTGANGILLENISVGGVKAYTERTYMHNVHIGYSGQNSAIPGNTHGLHLAVNDGTTSFGYNDFDVWFNVETGQTGLLVDTNAVLYNSSVNLKGNIDSTSATTSFMTTNGQFALSELNIRAESVSGSHTDVIYTSSTGQVFNQGNVEIFAADAGSTGYVIPPNTAAGGFYEVDPWLALNYPSLSQNITPPLIPNRPMMQTGYLSVSSDGTIVVAQGYGATAYVGDLEGRLILSWPNNTNRAATMIIDVACAQFETVSCTLNVPVNYSYEGQTVFTSPTIKLTSGTPAVPQIQVTVGNRNGVSQNVLASWYGAPGDNMVLFPQTAAGTTAVPLVGSNPTVFADLPTCVSGLKGQTAVVTDSSIATYNAIITGSGSNTVIGLCNGTNWTAH